MSPMPPMPPLVCAKPQRSGGRVSAAEHVTRTMFAWHLRSGSLHQYSQGGAGRGGGNGNWRHGDAEKMAACEIKRWTSGVLITGVSHVRDAPYCMVRYW